MNSITVLDENGLGIPNVEYSNGSESLTTDESGTVEFESGKTFTRNENIAPPTQVAEVRLNFLPNEIKK
jgi:hypothetical protein